MYQALGLLSVLLLPVLVIYLFRLNNNIPASSPSKKSKKKKKSKASKKAADATDLTQPKPRSTSNELTSPKSLDNESKHDEPEPINAETSARSGSSKKNGKAPKAKTQTSSPPAQPSTATTTTTSSSSSSTPAVTAVPERNVKKQQQESDVVDEHMDWTPKYARVMRITQELEEEPWQQVPYERGWEPVPVKKASSSSASPSRVITNDESLTKKQRANQIKAIKRREAKEAAEALQAQRLRQHKKELERLRIDEFYSTGAGKHTQWGKKPQQQRGSSKVPTGRASLNEQGQLIWD